MLSDDHLLKSLANRSTLPAEVLAVPGFATPNLRGFLNAVCTFPDCRYLEVGTLHGASLIAASYRNPGYFLGIDNFSQFEGNSIRLQLGLHKFRNECNALYRHCDSLTVPISAFSPGVDVFFYDGHHSEEATRDTIVRFGPLFAERFILIVDDYSWLGPKRGTQAAICELGLRVRTSVAIEDNYNRRGWGIGLFAALCEK